MKRKILPYLLVALFSLGLNGLKIEKSHAIELSLHSVLFAFEELAFTTFYPSYLTYGMIDDATEYMRELKAVAPEAQEALGTGNYDTSTMTPDLCHVIEKWQSAHWDKFSVELTNKKALEEIVKFNLQIKAAEEEAKKQMEF